MHQSLVSGESAGLLDCLLRSTCLPSLPDELMEEATTFLLAWGASEDKHSTEAVNLLALAI